MTTDLLGLSCDKPSSWIVCKLHTSWWPNSLFDFWSSRAYTALWLLYFLTHEIRSLRSTQVSPWVDQITVRTRLSPNCADFYRHLCFGDVYPHLGVATILTLHIARETICSGPSLHNIFIARCKHGGIPLHAHL